MKKYRIDEITINLDNKRKPLNNKERKAISKFKLYPYYGANNIVDYVDEYIFDEEILCVAEDGGSWGYNEECAYIVNQKCWVNNHAHVLKAKNNLNIRYLSYYLNFKNLSNVITGTTRGKLTKSALNSIEILLPELNKQDKIVEILEKSKELMDKRKEQIEALDELVKSKFIEMFGDSINNPMGWQVKKLKDISTKILSGNTPKGGSEVYVDKGVMFFRSQNVWKNKLILDDIAYIDEDTHNKMLKSSLKYRDILMTKTGRINTENSSLGRAAMYLGEDDKANINGHVYLIRLKEEILNEFILFILTSKEYRGYIRSVCVGGIDKRQLNKEHIEDFPIIFPPIEQQKEFVTYVKQVDKLKFEMEKSLKELEDSFNSLMQRAFNGELF
ncbi:restriction endonuclease subunit S [Clostridium paraputrificum]|uniref:restriction endonuclease subunit S n=1 Tax=Clostridium paraputrificum TaxID=29363 RepID=UPI0018AC70F3|nr:restriction endonuclease subunit S [Clostridium paraputrificum]MDB2098321.1 restriction endonuclease subunit S [Clostridium paraputrificum]